MRVGLSWMRTDRFRRTAHAGWADGRVGALELTLEHAFGDIPEADEALFHTVGEAGWLLGHGVHYSPGSHAWGPVDADWLRRVEALARRFRFRWVTEHFGVLRAGGRWAAPLPLPYTRVALERATERLERLAEAVQVPVGLENLALAWSAEDARRQADFVAALLEAVDGLMVLDVHNLWCQAVNYDLDPVLLLEAQPLERVRQLHVSGGSWSDWPEGRFRRDTHDGPVPDGVWELLPEALARCPRVEVLTLERLGPAIDADPASWEAEIDLLGALESGLARLVLPPRRRLPTDGDPAPAIDRLFAAEDRSVEGLRAAGGHWLKGADPRALRTAGALFARYSRTF